MPFIESYITGCWDHVVFRSHPNDLSLVLCWSHSSDRHPNAQWYRGPPTAGAHDPQIHGGMQKLWPLVWIITKKTYFVKQIRWKMCFIGFLGKHWTGAGLLDSYRTGLDLLVGKFRMSRIKNIFFAKRLPRSASFCLVLVKNTLNH